MKFRNRAWLSALVFVCTLLSTQVSVWAEDDDQNGVQFAALPGDLAQQAAGVQTVPFSTEPIEPAQYNGDVRDLPPDFRTSDYYYLLNEFPRPIPQRTVPPGIDMPVSPPELNAPMPSSTSFAGLALNTAVTGGTAGSGFPPDTNGDVGPVYYIQSVNSAFGIFNKSTGAMVAAFTENQLWLGAGTGTACDASNRGDPVVVHDGAADRWILSQFAFTSSFSGAHYQCIAVSKTNDPVAGGWWLYAVRTDIGGSGPPANSLLDYPKFGVWTDCLYMGGNVFTNATTYGGGAYAAFSRTALFAGTPLSGTNSSVAYTANANIFGMFPATLSGNGTSPPAGRSEFFVVTSPTVYGYDVRNYVQGANVCGSGASLSSVTTVNEASYGYPADVAGATTDIVPQPSPGNTLDSLGDEIMQRVVYRNVSGTESLWVTHTTCGTGISVNGTCSVDTNPTQVQWSQLNVTGGTIATTPVQQQIYAPDATFYRWMPSLAVDGQGNMAIGYSRSNGTAGNYPTLAYSGRLAGDTLNQLPQTETVMTAGGGAQSNLCGSPAAPCRRWGDYSAMTIDPADDCTFWFTSEYYDTVAHGASGTWQTRIGSFKFPTCITVGAASKLAFTQQPNASYASNATITVKVSVEDAAGNVVTTDTSNVTVALTTAGGATLGGTKTVAAVNGVATFNNLTVDKVGTYTLTATDGALTSAVSSSFNITAGAASAISFSTQPVTSVAGATIPVVAHVQDAAGNPISGDNVTLAIQNNAGGSTLTVTTNPVATNASGDATFASVSLNKVGTGYTLKVTDTNLLTTNSSAFNITTGAASAISFSTQPVTSAAGATIPVVAHVQDANGNPISGDAVTLAIQNNAGGSTLTVTTNPVSTNASGDATFAGVSLNKVGTGYTLKVTDTNLLTTNSNAFNITAGAASAISFSTQPVTSAAGATNPVVAHVQDANGNPISGDNVTLAIQNNAGGSTLTVTTNPVSTNASGDATFSGVSLNKVGTAYTLKVTDTNLLTTNSSAFNITVGAASAISFSTQPVTSAAGATIPVVAHVQDASGNPISGDNVTLAIANNASGSTLTVTTNPVATNASGNATFGGVSLNKVGTGYTLKVTNTTALTTNSNAFNITAGAASAISFSTQPVTSTAGATIPLVAHVQDANGNPISGDNVTLAIQNNAGGSTLTVTTNPVSTNASGDATFSGVSLNKVGTGYTVKVTDTNLLTTNSSAFNITAAAATQLVFTTQPANVIRGAVLGTVAVTEEDANGNVVADNGVVNFTITACSAPVSLGSIAMVNGIATLVSSQRFYTLASGLQIGASTGTLSGTSQSFNVQASVEYIFADGHEGCRL